MPSIILGLSALLLGATGQRQYRPGGSGYYEEGSFSGSPSINKYGDYLDYQEQAQYRPGASSDYEYEYVNSITGDASGENQKEEIEVNEGQSQYESQNGIGSFVIAGSTGNVGTGINGDLENLAGELQNGVDNGQNSQMGTTASIELSQNSSSASQNSQESNTKIPVSSEIKPVDSSTSSNKNPNKADQKEWSLAESIPGAAGDDYPIFSSVPDTSFLCDGLVPGGYYADPEADCQSFHVCASDGRGGLTKFSFLCPNGTIFNQQILVCDWWFNVDCSLTEAFYSINEKNAAEREENIGVNTQNTIEDTNEKSKGQKTKLTLQGETQALTDDKTSISQETQETQERNPFGPSNGEIQGEANDRELKEDGTPRNIVGARTIQDGTNRAENGNKGRENSLIDNNKNGQKVGYIAPEVTQGNQNKQTFQNGNFAESEETSNLSGDILPIEVGYGAPGGRILGNYN